MLRLTSQASELFLQQCAAEQRRLPQMVVANATWKDGALQTTLFEPFEILRHSNRESHRKENENSGDRMRFGSLAPRHGFETQGSRLDAGFRGHSPVSWWKMILITPDWPMRL